MKELLRSVARLNLTVVITSTPVVIAVQVARLAAVSVARAASPVSAAAGAATPGDNATTVAQATQRLLR